MTRNGKIARLPWKIREEVNRRLRDNVPGTKICEWVNRLPACRKVCAEFARRGGYTKSPVTVNQLSEWRRGGFQDWLREQAALEESRELRVWCAQLARDGGDITEGVATLLSAQLLKLVQGMGKHQASKRPSSREIPSSKLQNHSNAECGVRSAESPESAVRLLDGLVKCLSGIRRGDHNRVRLEQSERKLVLRSKLAAIKLEKYEKEKAEQEELERQKRAEELRRKSSPVAKLDDRGKIDLVRGKLFGPDLVVKEREAVLAEREKETKRLREELEILKAEMPPSRRSKKSNAPQEAPTVQAPSVQRSSKDQVPSSNVSSATPSGCEQIRVDTSAYDQNKNVAGGGMNAGGSKMEDGRLTANCGQQGVPEAKAQGTKAFDVKAALREVREVDKELAALRGEQPASCSEQSQEQDGFGDGPYTEISTVWDPNATLRELKEFDSEAALRELEDIKKEVAALKARQQMSSSDGGTEVEGQGEGS